MGGIGFFAFFMFASLIAVGASFRVLREYERGVLYTLGRYAGVKGPGLLFVMPVIQNIMRVDLRDRKFKVTEDIPTSDGQPLPLVADGYFRVIAPDKAVNNVSDYVRATSEVTQTVVREKLRGSSRGDILGHLEKLSGDIRAALEAQTAAWGVSIRALALREPGPEDSIPINQIPSAQS